jgi:hypothetical protein
MFERNDATPTPHGWLFHETISPSLWWIFVVVFSSISYFLFSKVHMKGIELKHLAWFNLFIAVSTVIPFAVYAWKGITWTGMALSEVHRNMIDNRHAILMGIWSIVSVIQMGAYLVGGKRFQAVHNQVGKFGMYLLLPTIFLELHFNAVVVAWPEKPILLIRALHGGDIEPTLWQIIIYTFPVFYVMTTPVSMMQYWYNSWQNLQAPNRNIRLHAIYMTMFVTSTANAGMLRMFIQSVFALSHCPPHTESETTIVVQFLGASFVAAFELLILSTLYTVMTPAERKSRAARYTYAWYFFHANVVWIASAILKIPAGIRCGEGANGAATEL